jgi:hypothetical protein
MKQNTEREKKNYFFLFLCSKWCIASIFILIRYNNEEEDDDEMKYVKYLNMTSPAIIIIIKTYLLDAITSSIITTFDTSTSSRREPAKGKQKIEKKTQQFIILRLL